MPATDSAKRRMAQRRKGYRGMDIHITGPELEAAGWPLDAPPPYYKVASYQRSAKGSTIIVSLYGEP